MLQGAHRGGVWAGPQVEAQAQQTRSGEQTLQLCNQILLFLQFIALKERKR